MPNVDVTYLCTGCLARVDFLCPPGGGAATGASAVGTGNGAETTGSEVFAVGLMVGLWRESNYSSCGGVKTRSFLNS